MGKYDHILYRHEKLFQVFTKAQSVIPATGLAAMGVAIARDYAVTGRIDLLLGGTALALLGVGVADIALGKNVMARIFNKISSPFQKRKIEVSQGDVLTFLGVGSCAILGAGEAISYLSQHSHISLSDLFQSPSLPKIIANMGPYMVVSCFGVSAIANRLNRYISGDNIKNLSTACNMAGTALIYNFAQKAHLPAYEILAGLQGVTIWAGEMFWLCRQQPVFFMPTYDMDPEEELRMLTKVMEEDGGLDHYRKEYSDMLMNRGLFTSQDLEKMGFIQSKHDIS